MRDPNEQYPLAVCADQVEIRTSRSAYPEPFCRRVEGREKRVLGNLFGLRNFGVNLATLRPGSQSSLLHRHSRQDEFVYVIEGTPKLVTEEGRLQLRPGMCAGFPAKGRAHHLVNDSNANVSYLEIGDRTPNDEGTFPADDIRADLDSDGKWFFSHKDGKRY